MRQSTNITLTSESGQWNNWNSNVVTTPKKIPLKTANSKASRKSFQGSNKGLRELLLRIPDDVDQCSGACRSVDYDRRNGDRDGPECFPQGEVTLDNTIGKLFFLFKLRERQRADQEIVHA